MLLLLLGWRLWIRRRGFRPGIFFHGAGRTRGRSLCRGRPRPRPLWGFVFVFIIAVTVVTVVVVIFFLGTFSRRRRGHGRCIRGVDRRHDGIELGEFFLGNICRLAIVFRTLFGGGGFFSLQAATFLLWTIASIATGIAFCCRKRRSHCHGIIALVHCSNPAVVAPVHERGRVEGIGAFEGRLRRWFLWGEWFRLLHQCRGTGVRSFRFVTFLLQLHDGSVVCRLESIGLAPPPGHERGQLRIHNCAGVLV